LIGIEGSSPEPCTRENEIMKIKIPENMPVEREQRNDKEKRYMNVFMNHASQSLRLSET